MNRIILVEDDHHLNTGVAYAIRQKGYAIDTFTSGYNCLLYLSESTVSYDLAILDIGLPDLSGFELGKQIRDQYNIPLIFLTAKDEETEILSGYAIGCEDYITKPFSLPVLIEKINVILLRLNHEIGDGTYIKGDLKFDFDKKQFMKSDSQINLTAKEMDLLEILVQHKNQILTKDQLLEHVWDFAGDFVDDNTLSVTIRRLRKKIEPNPKAPVLIKTVFGIGYKWCD